MHQFRFPYVSLPDSMSSRDMTITGFVFINIECFLYTAHKLKTKKLPKTCLPRRICIHSDHKTDTASFPATPAYLLPAHPPQNAPATTPVVHPLPLYPLRPPTFPENPVTPPCLTPVKR
ncbi:unnamed protein product [Acanthoscelides obtectus]|uniref:Uncharacterized protein n=1 Tax=Acanthoscelides obtectus TaxID=200917 RepID=A0A9P0JYG0_ACAOB|nr:unnamed protein product [Acanthoscelides obtectus]CAK1648720.1 hypothetical protein AOBTE_LOCUS15834 [Acanthoscelides obtectus]